MPEVSNIPAPPIHVSEEDYDRIAAMALRLEQSNPDLSKLILDELDRAEVYPREDLPADVVCLGSELEFADSEGASRKIKLVLPQDADVSAGRISVMTSVGAGLIGMRKGASISWPCPDGRARELKILSVHQQQ